MKEKTVYCSTCDDRQPHINNKCDVCGQVN